MRRSQAFQLVLISAVVLAACRASAPTTTVADIPSVTAVPTTEPIVTTTAPPTTQPVEPDEGDGRPQVLPTGEVFTATDVQRFRSATSLVLSRDEAGEDVVIATTVDASYVREPDSIEAIIVADGREVGVIGINGTFWIEQGGEWSVDPIAEQVLSLTSVTALAPESLGAVLDGLDEVGIEDVNGRPATHFRGDVSDIEAWLGDTSEVAQFGSLDVGQIDIWIDDAGFMSKAAYVFGGVRANSSATEFYSVSFEMFDFDADFEIVAPVVP